MKFTAITITTAFLSSTVSLASASASASSLIVGTDSSFPVDSDLGRKLLASSSSRALENNNNYYYSWISGYSVKFDGCVSVPRFEREEGMGAELYAKFKLCPTGTNGCRNGGEYVVAMREFIESMQKADEETCQYQLEDCQYMCENGYYNANANNAQIVDGNAEYNYYNNQNNNQNNNNGGNEEYCQYSCLNSNGYGYCANEQNGQNNNNNNNNGGQDMNMDELSECRPLNEQEGGGEQNNYNYNRNNYQMYYVGAYCTSSGVYAGVFTDSMCTKHAPSGTYEKYNYGYSLPTSPLVSTDSLSCKASNNNNGNNNQNGGNGDWNGNNIMEVCEELYEQSVKCESNVKNTQYKDTSGCEMIHSILPQMNASFKSMTGFPVAKFFAWVFGLGFFALGGYVYLLHKKVVRQKTELAALGYGEAPGKTTGYVA